MKIDVPYSHPLFLLLFFHSVQLPRASFPPSCHSQVCDRCLPRHERTPERRSSEGAGCGPNTTRYDNGTRERQPRIEREMCDEQTQKLTKTNQLQPKDNHRIVCLPARAHMSLCQLDSNYICFRRCDCENGCNIGMSRPRVAFSATSLHGRIGPACMRRGGVLAFSPGQTWPLSVFRFSLCLFLHCHQC